MSAALVTLSATLCFIIGSPKNGVARRAAHDLKHLQGVWVLKSVESADGETDQEPEPTAIDRIWEYRDRLAEERELPSAGKHDRLTLEFAGDRFVIRQRGRTTAEGTFRLDATANQRKIERKTTGYRYHCTRGACSVYMSKSEVVSLYVLERDTLKWCQHASADSRRVPPRFATGVGDWDTFILTFHRVTR